MTRGQPRRPAVLREHGDQVAVMEWRSTRVVICPALRLLHATPNAAKRSSVVAAMLAAEGMAPGWPDLELNVARRGYAGWFCELKHEGNGPTPDQVEAICWLNLLGNYALCAVGSEAVIRSLEWYLDIPEAYRAVFL